MKLSALKKKLKMEVRMLNSKLIKSKSFHIVMLGALMAQAPVQAFSIATYADAAKNAAQATASSIANSSYAVAAKDFVQAKANSIVTAAKNNPEVATVLAFYGALLATLVVINVADEYSKNKKIAACYAEQEKARAEAQAHIDALSLDDLLKIVNANVLEAQQLFNEVDGSRIIELNYTRYNYELSEEEMEALYQELTFVCAAQQHRSWSTLYKAQDYLEKSVAMINHRITMVPYEEKTTLESMVQKINSMLQEVRDLRSIIENNAARYQEQASSDFNQKVEEYRAQNPTEQVTLIAHNCGNNCLKALSCDCSGCACTTQTALQS